MDTIYVWQCPLVATCSRYFPTGSFSFDWSSSSLEFENKSFSSLGYKGMWDFLADRDGSISEIYMWNLDGAVLYMGRGRRGMRRKCPTLLSGKSVRRISCKSGSSPFFSWMNGSQYELGEKASFGVLSSAVWPWALCLST